MRNKKGFTLVEVLVSIGLLALLGSVIAISLNRVFKDNNIKNYDEYVEKIKSAAMLYVNNTVDIINDLNDNSFKIITIGDLVDNGYLAVEPIPPIGAFKVAETNQAGEIKAAVTSYTVTPNNGVTPKTVTINAGTNIDLKTLMTRKNN